jgi:citrate lyase beta subunit
VNACAGAFEVGGMMVDAPAAQRATRLLERALAIGGRRKL